MINNIIEYIKASSEKFPNRIAFKDENNSINYGDLQEEAQRIGASINTILNGATRKPIVVFIDRSIKSLISFMGVVYSGNFYVPIDCTQPRERIELIFDTLKPALSIGHDEIKGHISKIGDIDNLHYYEDFIARKVDTSGIDAVQRSMINTDPLYAMFTSGSTGVPKGAVISHLSVIDLVDEFSREFKFTENTIFGNQAPFDFDVSVKDIYSSIKHGSTLSIIPKVCFSFPSMLIAYLEKEKIDTCIWSTSVLRLVENLKGLDAAKPTSLKMIMFSGEVMPNKILNYWRRHLPEVTYVNLYGPTEITCNCSFYIVDRSYNDDDVLPIGRQFKNTEIFILTEDHKEAEIDEIGEICVRGSSLALGYYNNPEVTEKVFVQNPLNTHYRDLIYKTGDLGRVSNDGLLYFISRKDHQIKHMGHRIELGEIEVVANSIGKINMACCIFDKAKEKIMLFYEAAEESNKEIYREMLLKLPKYMIPNKMIWFDKLPLNKNGKIDRVYLKKVHIDEQA